MTPLLLAISERKEEAAVALITNGANLEYRDSVHLPPGLELIVSYQ
jgi:hypothetical protein